MKIYHNPKCRKSQQTLELIRQSGLEPEIVEYLKTPPSVTELTSILAMLNMEPDELMRTGELIYKQLDIGNMDISREEKIALMVEHPKLIERPIVVKGNQAIIGRPPETVQTLL
ncbi:Uncharacterized protein YfgD, not an arsenate reductase [hydrothermal vent metagenome]|uniref:Uncharacterized protein YfgD, not an arsenate reductase n=1 Tax=hydrothermal vent metagenome TaxID=652676 RepID=A0A3B1DU67_9ZZZZ